MCSAKGVEAQLQKKVIHASEQDRDDVRVKRAWWQLQQAGLDAKRLVFIDETWVKTNMTRPRGRSLKGSRLVAKVPHGHWKTTTFIAGLRSTGLIAPMVIDGAINGDIFAAYAREVLAPELSAGDVVVLDNLSSHRRLEARQAIEAVGARLLFLPPYSPDFNPIENAFSKFKWLLQSEKHRDETSLWQACGRLLDQFKEAECRNYITHCGYCYD